jgi:hypothetical protein
MPELTIGTPSGVFSILAFDERIEVTREFQSIAAGLRGIRAVGFLAVFMLFAPFSFAADNRPHT